MKKNIKNLKQVHGKNEFEPQTLDQVWGDKGDGKYDTLDVEEYTKTLSEMNKADLQTHAVKANLIPVDDRRILSQRLINEFKKHVASYQAPKSVTNEIKISKKVSDILAEGR